MYFMIDRVLVVVVGVLLLIAGITDIRKRQISRRLLMLLTLVCIVAVLVRGSFAVMAAGGMAIGLCVIGISMISREQIGRGDGIVIAVIGLVLGFRRCLAVVSVASLVMCAAAIVVLLFKKGNRRTQLAFLPALFVGYVLCGAGG